MPILPLLLLTLAPAGGNVVVSATEKADARCSMPPGWDEVDRLHPRYVVFGELHGTREAPAFVTQVVCALAARGKRVLFAIEHPATEDEALRDAWNLPERRFADALFRTAWTLSNDGRDSRAMFDMIVRPNG